MNEAYHIRQCLSSFIFINCINSDMSRPVTRATAIPIPGVPLVGGTSLAIGDFHAGHICVPILSTYHATPFISGSPNVFTNGQPTVRFGDKTACTDTAVPLQGSVFVNGKPIATKGSPTSGHLPCFHPTVIAHGSPNVFAAQGGA